MLVSDLILLTIAVVATLIILNVAFLLLTRRSGAEPDETNAFIKLIRPIAFLIGQLFWTTFCLLGIAYLILQSPNNPIAARYPELAAERIQAFMKQPVEGNTAIVIYGLLFLFVIGAPASIWMLISGIARLREKTWDDPGDGISRFLRATSILLAYGGFSVVALIVIIVLITLFGSRIAGNIETLPTLLTRLEGKSQAALVYLGLFLLIPLWLVGRGVFKLIKELRTLNWQSIEGEITSGRIEQRVHYTNKGNRSVSHHFEATYNYTVDGKAYTGHQVRVTAQNGSYAQAWLLQKQFPVGERVTVYYNSDRAGEAALLKGIQWHVLVSNVSLAALVIVILLLIDVPLR